MARHPYNVRPDPWHPHDVHLSAVQPLHQVVLPPKVDLRPLMDPVRDQGQLGACTAFAGTAVRYGVARKEGRTPPELSPLFLYYQERVLDGDVNSDSGSTLRTTMQVLSSVGVCPETDDPYDPSRFTQPPSPQALADAAVWKVSNYYRLASLSDMLACLAQGYPFEIAIWVYPELESGTVAQTGILSLPGPNEPVLGGHALAVVGYDMSQQMLLVKNSWGYGWGQGGYFWLPFGWINEPKLWMDAWTVRA